MRLKPQYVLCWNCREKNDPNNTFCQRCGEGLNNLQFTNQRLENQQLNDLQSNLKYTRIFDIRCKVFTLNEFSVFENNQLKYKIQNKRHLLGVIFAPIFFVLIFLFCLISLILSSSLIPDVDGLWLIASVSIGLVTVFLVLLLVLFIVKIVLYTTIDDCLLNQTIGRVKMKGLNKNKWIFNDYRSNSSLDISFNTKTSGIFQRQLDTFKFSKNSALPEIDLSSNNKRILRFILGPEYERRFNGNYRKDFQIQADETLTDAEILFFASTLIDKFKFKTRKKISYKYENYGIC